jgi:Type II secretory pathway, pseudopilin PulG
MIQNHRKQSARKGMTLIEVMLVLFILMTLAGVGMVSIREFQKRANINTARMHLGELATLLDNYESQIGFLPSTEEGLNSLCQCPASVDETVWFKIARWDTPPNDPWGMQYNYQFPGRNNTEFDLWSSGPDGQSNTDDDLYYERK